MKHSGITIGVILLLIAASLSFAGGEYLSKKYAQSPTFWCALAVTVAYASGAIFWLPAIAQTNTLVITGVVWNVLAFLTTVIIGIVVFHESLSPMAVWGIAFGLVSVIFLCLA